MIRRSIYLFVLGILLLVIFKYSRNSYIEFSDTAKYAEVARNLYKTGSWFSTFTFFYPKVLPSFFQDSFLSTGILPLYSYVISIFYWALGVSDYAVIFTSYLFYGLTSLVAYLLVSRISNKFVGFLSSLSILFSPQMIEFAKNGASETLFIFEMVLAAYFISLKKNIYSFFAFLTFILLYFTRPQAFIYILGLFVFYLLLNFKVKKSILILTLSVVIGVLLDITLLSRFEGKYFLYSIISRGADISSSHSLNNAVSDTLRGLSVSNISYLDIIKKLFYNLYNFYKAIPQIINPYMFTLFVLGLFKWDKNRLLSSFKISSIIVTCLTFLMVAVTIPFYRYIHPVIPFVYIVSVVTLHDFLTTFISGKWLNLSLFLITVTFCIGQTLGIVFLDSRFEKKIHNFDKPPIYIQMSYKLKEITNENQVVLTNLDTWGSWYGERKTIWFPLEPSMIGQSPNKIDAIYLTSYKIDDENYYMGDNWRKVFLNPEKQTLLPDYKYVGKYTFGADDNYEKEVGYAILLIRK